MTTGGGRHPQFARPFALEFPQWQALQFAEMERAGVAPEHSEPTFLPKREDFSRVTTPKHEWRVSVHGGYTEDPELLGFDPKLGPHTEVLEVAGQMSGLDDSIKRQQREGIAWGMVPAFVDAPKGSSNYDRIVRAFGAPAEKPCKGCADKAKLVERVLDAHKREIDSLRVLLVSALADIELLKARGLPLPY